MLMLTKFDHMTTFTIGNLSLYLHNDIIIFISKYSYSEKPGVANFPGIISKLQSH